MNPGDPILLEAPLYAGVLPYLQSIDAEMIGKSAIPAPLRLTQADLLCRSRC